MICRKVSLHDTPANIVALFVARPTRVCPYSENAPRPRLEPGYYLVRFCGPLGGDSCQDNARSLLEWPLRF